jgi:glycosyltransferase involved in cell wall biosynthesis
MSERLLDNSGHKTLCFSEKDKTLIRNISHKDVFVVPFYINTSIREIDCSKIEIENYFVFYGAWNRNENEEGLVWFIEQVYPQLDTELQFRIIGGQMRESVKEKIAKYSNIEYLGFVENPYLILSKSQALIAPLFNGAGVKVKVLESLATGTPVIGSSVAHEGLMEYANINGQKMMYLADNSNDMVKALSEWTLITSSEKVSAKESFLNRYLGSTNHLKDIFSC